MVGGKHARIQLFMPAKSDLNADHIKEEFNWMRPVITDVYSILISRV